MNYRGLELDPFQERAFECIKQHRSLIVSAPTGSGKTLIAEYAIEVALSENCDVIYTAPIKALSNQKFRDFTRYYGSDQVGIMTGDVTYHTSAPILIMTTEIFRNAIFEESSRFDRVLYLVLDEVHYLDDAERGSVWEESIIFAPEHIQTLCLSATVPNVEQLANWIGKVRGREINVILENHRPVPLQEMCITEQGIITAYEAYQSLPKKIRRVDEIRKRSTIPIGQITENALGYLQQSQQLPCLYFVFSRKECERRAQRYSKYQFLSQDEKSLVKARFSQMLSSYGLQNSWLANHLGTLLVHGIGYHHAGMIPACKEIVEQLFAEGLIKLLFATETFALGVNMPARSVFFDALKKYDGIEVRNLKALEYQQMSGRAGRRGIDAVGYVYANIAGEIMTSDSFKKILGGPLETIESQFNLSYSTLLSLYSRIGMNAVNTYDKSFGAYQRELTIFDKKQKHILHTQQRQLVKKKLALMRSLGYITDEGLTSKGQFAMFINGYEITLTELFFAGFFENKSEHEIFAILVALVSENKMEQKVHIPKNFRHIAQAMFERIQPALALEQMLDIKSEIKIPDFALVAAALEWVKGSTFTGLFRVTNAAAGDIIRSFRQAIQLCRQLRKACQGYSSFIGMLDICLEAVNRDEVNALTQLQAFSEI